LPPALLTVGFVLLGCASPVSAQPEPDAKELKFTGRTEARTVEIRPRVTGYITRFAAQEGAMVKAGDLIAEIDSRVPKIEVDVAKAKLTQAEAKLRLAEARHARAKQAAAAGTATREELDQAAAELEVAKAEIVLAKAELEFAEWRLSCTKVTAPFDGRLAGSSPRRETSSAPTPTWSSAWCEWTRCPSPSTWTSGPC